MEASLVPGRTSEQCRRRWVYALDPVKKKEKWTLAEDAKLMEAVKKRKCANNWWVTVAKLVPGRTNQHCRIRWVCKFDPTTGTGQMSSQLETISRRKADRSGQAKW
jgi:hypothetical protein